MKELKSIMRLAVRMTAIGSVSYTGGYYSNPVPVSLKQGTESVSVRLSPENIPASGSKPVPRLSLTAVATLGQSEKTGGGGCNCGGGNCACDEEKSQIDKLKKIDQETRAHEQAHKNAGGPYASAASFTYEIGPDNKQYAVGGEVKIDTAPIAGDPAATIDKLEIVIKAALAPAKPSAQDFKVAAQAQADIQKAQAELQAKKKDEQQGVVDETGPQDDQIAELVSAAIA